MATQRQGITINSDARIFPVGKQTQVIIQRNEFNGKRTISTLQRGPKTGLMEQFRGKIDVDEAQPEMFYVKAGVPALSKEHIDAINELAEGWVETPVSVAPKAAKRGRKV